MGKVNVDHFIHHDFQLTIIKVGHNITEKLIELLRSRPFSKLEVKNDDVKTKG